MIRIKNIAAIWGLGFLFIALGQLVDHTNPDFNPANWLEWSGGDTVTVTGFGGVILASLLRVIKAFTEKQPEVDPVEIPLITGGRTFGSEKVITYLDKIAIMPAIIPLLLLGGFAYASPEIFRQPLPYIEAFGGFAFWIGLCLALWRLIGWMTDKE
jgi:hypothetical protein